MHPSHNDSIIEQFTKQAKPFAKKQGHSDERAFRVMYELTDVNHDDIVLDLACGPGLVSCAFVKVTKHVTGIDVTPLPEKASTYDKIEKLRDPHMQEQTIRGITGYGKEV